MSHLRLRFTLPETDVLVHATGEVRWQDSTGRTGVRLVAIDCKPNAWHGWFEKTETPALTAIEPPKDRQASETNDSTTELISYLRDNLSLPVPPKSSDRSLPWLGAGLLMMAVSVGIIVGGRSVLSAFLPARHSVAASVAAQGLPSGNPKGNREKAETQITAVEGSPALAAPTLADPAQATITHGRLLHRTDLAFPEAALNSGVAGDVQAVLTISEKGSVEQVDILEGDDRLANEVVTAVEHWRYLPFKFDGTPVSVKLPLTVSFVLRQPGRNSGNDGRR